MFSRDATGAPGLPGPSRMLWTRGPYKRPSHTSGPHTLTVLHPAGPVPCSSYTEDASLWDAVHRGTEQLGLLFFTPACSPASGKKLHSPTSWSHSVQVMGCITGVGEVKTPMKWTWSQAACSKDSGGSPHCPPELGGVLEGEDVGSLAINSSSHWKRKYPSCSWQNFWQYPFLYRASIIRKVRILLLWICGLN